MNPFQAAIMRILLGHYGGNLQNPRFQTMVSRLAQNSIGQQRVNQSFLGQLGAGVMPQGYSPYQGHYIPGGSHVAG